MLVMAFNKDAAKEVTERVAHGTGDSPESYRNNIRTIHSFALEIAKDENAHLEILADEKEMKNFVKKVLEKHKSGDNRAAYIGKVINLFGNTKPKEKINKYKNIPEPGKNIKCSDGTVVRSKAENRIVEKLIKNRIRFEYEPMVAWADMYFEPDFFFPDFGIYAEYWGMMNHENEGIRTRYCEQMKWKQEQFGKYGLPLINLEPQKESEKMAPEDRLIAILSKMTPGKYAPAFERKIAKIFNFLEDQLVVLIITVMDVAMAYGKKICDLAPGTDPFVKAVINFIVPLCEELEMGMELKNKATFTKILYVAVSRLKKDRQLVKSLQEKYKCIFVDEVQDLQPLTRRFIRLLTGKEQNLFAIGDDYQSIYSFAGSDPSFIVKFEHYFPEARVLELKYNYRCHPGIVRVSNKIIRNNKVQHFKAVEGKLLEGQLDTDKVLTVIRVADESGHREALADYLLSQIPEKENIQILGRYSEVMPEIEPYMNVINQKFSKRNYKYLTIHRSKGLQADNVIILGCVNRGDGVFCFPAKDNFHSLKDRILGLYRDHKFSLIEEETRLFYVAVTRAKKRVFVVTVTGQESEFIGEKYLPQDMVKNYSFTGQVNI
jgi:superfamily I DNA/RNA helicase